MSYRASKSEYCFLEDRRTDGRTDNTYFGRLVRRFSDYSPGIPLASQIMLGGVDFGFILFVFMFCPSCIDKGCQR